METDKIYHADCMAHLPTMAKDSVDLTLTDIPYGEVNRYKGKLRSLDKGAADVMTFDLTQFLSEVYRITKGTAIIFCGQQQVSEIVSFFAKKKGTVRQIIWEKTNPAPLAGQHIYLSGIENAVWFRKPNATFNAHCKNTVFRYPCGRSKQHPTEKPVGLLKELIEDNSNAGDIVFDPCAGSGSTLLAAHDLGRQYIGVELNEEYYSIAAGRLGMTCAAKEDTKRIRLNMQQSQMTVVDLFAGYGGMSRGFQNAGFDVVAAFENWDKAADCYKANFKHPVFRDDLSDVDNAVRKIRALNPDGITGGPPCQDFSHAGKGIEGERAALTVTFAEIITAVRPKFFIMENVPRTRKSKAYNAARDIFESAGYGLTTRVLDASRCGVPQSRMRFFTTGLLGAEDGFLGDILDSALSEKPTTVRDCIGDKPGIENYYVYQPNYARKSVFSIDEACPTVRGVNVKRVPPGYPGHKNDVIPHTTPGLRPLTTTERARVQTFPDDFILVGSDKDKEQMIGNAVPVKLAEFVATAIAHHDSPRKAGV